MVKLISYKFKMIFKKKYWINKQLKDYKILSAKNIQCLSIKKKGLTNWKTLEEKSNISGIKLINE